MHMISPDGKSTVCHKVGESAVPSTANIGEATCLACLWMLAQLLLVQLTGTLGRLHVVERSKTVPL